MVIALTATSETRIRAWSGLNGCCSFFSSTLLLDVFEILLLSVCPCLPPQPTHACLPARSIRDQPSKHCTMVGGKGKGHLAVLGMGLTSYCCGKLRMEGSGRTDTHFFFALDITSRTRRSFVQLGRENKSTEAKGKAEQGFVFLRDP